MVSFIVPHPIAGDPGYVIPLGTVVWRKLVDRLGRSLVDDQPCDGLEVGDAGKGFVDGAAGEDVIRARIDFRDRWALGLRDAGEEESGAGQDESRQSQKLPCVRGEGGTIHKGLRESSFR
jgi:hypothetical protein